jgi:type I restriction enzyme M protein
MLDTETKRRIDTARDILVGKVPDPKSQVEQITIALIYKFMDDMDKEAISFGGKATFFTGEYEQYSWTNIFDTKVGGHEMLALYGEAITNLNLNPNIPQLFRDIFKNAYLPYRDPETLKLFLKTINEFSYDHSEMLGDAFEYLLSVLGSQGDAGQFRTPRHIIDFIVEVLQPKKTETICDPACGTAGFLISSYKHILQQNTKKNKGDMLTPDDRKKMMQNFVGYDISPDMVRLSLVNMYLHGFTTPSIYEYDTLTSEERWSEYFDVIIANPPFMSPKGGIKPHKKFTIQANRSEVLFVDYIAEHIHPSKGRAGIIVPEGIIFQSGTAYKALRKMLVDKNMLYAVVSLPAGIFQPYSGVKTSILLMDKTLAKKTDNILFVKIENDGFDLGAQRRAIGKNDLTGCLELLLQYKTALQNNTTFESDNKNVFLVEKEKIAAANYNLSIDHFRISENLRQSNFEMVRIGDVVEVLDSKRKPITKSDRKSGKYPYYGATGIVDYVDDFIFDERLVLVGEDGAKWNAGDKTAFIAEGKYWVNNHAHVLKPIEGKLLDIYLIEVLNYLDLNKFITGITVPKLNQEKLRGIEIPLPPFSIQQLIVEKLKSFQAIIDGAKQVSENYKPQIDIDENWDVVRLEEICEIKRGRFSHRPRNEPKFFEGKYPFIQTGDIVRAKGGNVTYTQTLNELGLTVSKLFKPTIVLVTIAANIGDTAILNYEACFTDSVVGLIPNEKVNPYYLELIMRTQKQYLNDIAPQAAQKNINIEILKPLEIPLPPISVQQEIVKRIEGEQALVNSNKKLIEIFEQKIKDEINKLWQAAPKEYAMPEEKLSIAAEE